MGVGCAFGYHQDLGPIRRNPVVPSVLAWLRELPLIRAIGVGDVVRMVVIARGAEEDDGALGVKGGLKGRRRRGSRWSGQTGPRRGARCHGRSRRAARAARATREEHGDERRQHATSSHDGIPPCPVEQVDPQGGLRSSSAGYGICQTLPERPEAGPSDDHPRLPGSRRPSVTSGTSSTCLRFHRGNERPTVCGPGHGGVDRAPSDSIEWSRTPCVRSSETWGGDGSLRRQTLARSIRGARLRRAGPRSRRWVAATPMSTIFEPFPFMNTA